MLVVLGVILTVLVIYLVIALTKSNPSDSSAPLPSSAGGAAAAVTLRHAA
jgi:hypothetical protein